MEKNKLTNIEISYMQEEDLAKLKDCLTQEFDDFWNINILSADFHNENTIYLVAKLDSEIVGFAGISIIIDEATIMDIVAKKNMRHIGIGSSLLQASIDLCKSKKLKSITLEVNEHNKNAINLYKKYQFKQVGERKNYYKNTDSAILMTLYI